PPDQEPILSGFARAADGLHVYAVAEVVPLSAKVRLGPGPTYLLAIAKKVDAAFLKQLSDNQQVRDLSVHSMKRGRSAEIALKGVDGEAQAWLSWRAARPGAELRHDILPLFLFVGLLTLGAAGLIIH